MKTLLTILLLGLLVGCAPSNYQRRSAYLADHPETRTDLAECISKGQIKTGMSKEQVVASWGHPCYMCGGTSETDLRGFSMTTWEYRSAWDKYGTDSTYLYFVNGRLDGWSD